MGGTLGRWEEPSPLTLLMKMMRDNVIMICHDCVRRAHDYFNTKMWHESEKLFLFFRRTVRSSHIPAAKQIFNYNNSIWVSATDWIHIFRASFFITAPFSDPSALCEYIKCHRGHYYISWN